MSQRLVICLSEESALVTVAMLSSLIREHHADYLDIISPFVVELLPTQVGQEVNAETIINGLKSDFGFEQFPRHVLMKILSRCSKDKVGLLQRRDGKYYVKKVVANKKFRESQNNIRQIQHAVMEALQQYFKDNSKYGNISIDETREKFLSFLENKGLVFIDGVDELKTVTNRDYDIYQVARFVLSEKEKRSVLFNQIEEVVRGFFVYKSIYFFSKDSIPSLNPKMTGTVVYFDTPLLIEVLGYNTTEGEIATRELVQLIKQSGGKVHTFVHLVDEVAGILTAYARDKIKRSQFSLQNLLDRNYDELDILRLRASLETNLSKIGITADAAISVTDYSKDEYMPMQINDLSHAIQVAYKQDFQTTRSDNDVRSVATIYHIRGNARSSSLSDCNAIVVTSNLGFTKTVYDFYKDKTLHEVGYVISDIDLTSILWLRSWDKKSNLPSIVLLENAYAACQPSVDLINAFSYTVEKLRLEGTISDEEALLLRTQRAPREELLEASNNDPSYVSDRTVLAIKQKYEEGIIGSRNDEIMQLKETIRANEKASREKEKLRRLAALEGAEQMAEKSAEHTAKFLSTISKVITAVLFLTGVIALIYGQSKANIGLLWEIPLMLIGIIGFLDSIQSRNGWITRHINKIKNMKFDSVYAEEVSRINAIFIDNE